MPGPVLDVACGGGRHTLFLAQRGFAVESVDRDLEPIRALLRDTQHERVTLRQADLENAPWPYPDRRFSGVVVTNYLHRPLFPSLIAALEPDGVLIYETFAVGNEKFGRPSNPDFLLRPGELLDAVRGRMRVIAYEDVFVETPKAALVQRICARVAQP